MSLMVTRLDNIAEAFKTADNGYLSCEMSDELFERQYPFWPRSFGCWKRVFQFPDHDFELWEHPRHGQVKVAAGWSGLMLYRAILRGFQAGGEDVEKPPPVFYYPRTGPTTLGAGTAVPDVKYRWVTTSGSNSG